MKTYFKRLNTIDISNIIREKKLNKKANIVQTSNQIFKLQDNPIRQSIEYYLKLNEKGLTSDHFNSMSPKQLLQFMDSMILDKVYHDIQLLSAPISDRM